MARVAVLQARDLRVVAHQHDAGFLGLDPGQHAGRVARVRVDERHRLRAAGDLAHDHAPAAVVGAEVAAGLEPVVGAGELTGNRLASQLARQADPGAQVRRVGHGVAPFWRKVAFPVGMAIPPSASRT
jgi:hypothetical protein